MRWFIASQSMALMASSITFPFYLLFIHNIGSNFSSFGIAYGVFTLSSALFHKGVGTAADKIGGKSLLYFYSFGMAFLFLLIPEIHHLWQVYVFQFVLGGLGSIQKTCEKTLLAGLTGQENRGRTIGHYHFWTSLYAAAAVMACGVLIDYFTITIIFYLGSVFYFISGMTLAKMNVALSSETVEDIM
ncbi:MFS transporter [Falsibacillus pallidus]|uniref:MFS transporter n=1 Tax=Falsibacillus pallidus TaxID=493781 RepID=A0A370GQC4_9BACI|nr:MFS transporter [Falsibacillus pallidus]RDI45925.1 MFS transporter [Falsibacillus pallidus]